MSNDWDEYAEGWDDNRDVVLYSDEAFWSLQAVLANMGLGRQGLRILDFGCGTGLLTAKLCADARRVVAVDASEKMIDVLTAKQLPNVEAICGVVDEDSSKTNALLREPFDLIVASSVCSFLPDYGETLKVLASMLVPNGLFVQWDWLATDGEGDFGLTDRQIRTALHHAGLDVVVVEQVFAMPDGEGSMPVLMGAGKRA